MLRLIVLLMAQQILAPILYDTPTTAPSNYYSRDLTIATSFVTADVTGKTISFYGTLSYLATEANGGKVKSASGYDIRFYGDSGCSTLLPFFLVKWTASSGFIEAKVKTDLSSSVANHVYLCYGNASWTTDVSSQSTTFDSNTKTALFMGDGSTLTVTDYTGTQNGSTNNSPAAATGVISGGVDTTSGTITFGDLAAHDPSTGFAIEAWAKPTGTNANDVSVFSKYAWLANKGYGIWVNAGTRDTKGWIDNVSTSTTTMTNNTWYHLALAWNGTTETFYVNGASAATASVSTVTSSGSGANLIIGSIWTVDSRSFAGIIDEVYYHAVNRSAAWINIDYQNVAAGVGTGGGHFIEIGSEVGH